jgi:hypothetical protein
MASEVKSRCDGKTHKSFEKSKKTKKKRGSNWQLTPSPFLSDEPEFNAICLQGSRRTVRADHIGLRSRTR